jgi:hypothetical protein
MFTLDNGGYIYGAFNISNTTSIVLAKFLTTLNSISVSSSGQYAIVGSNTSNVIYYTSNYGVSWTQSASTTSIAWSSVAMSASGQFGCASASSGQIYYSSNYGQTWTQGYSNASNNWNTISISAAGRFVMAVDDKYVGISSNYGNNWIQSQLLTEFNRSFLSISCSGTQTIAADSRFLYYSSNYGVSWSTTLAISSSAISTVRLNGQYAVGTNYNDGIYTSINYGQTWVKSTQSGTSVFGAAISNNGLCITVVANGGSVSYTTSAPTNGSAVNNFIITSLPSINWNGVAMSSNGQYQTVISNVSVYISNNYGNGSWTLVGTGIANSQAVAMDPNGNGQNQLICTQNGSIWYSSNYGSTWTQSNAPNKNWWSISMSGGAAVACVSANDTGISGYVYYSVNYGVSWTQSNSILTNWVSVSISGSIAVATSSQPLTCYSTNGGSSWILSTINSIATSSSGQYGIVCMYVGIYYTTNYGASWLPSNSTNGAWSSCAVSSSGQYALAAITGGYIYYSVNYGQSWTVSSSVSGNWSSLALSSTGEIAYAGRSGTDIYRSVVTKNMAGNLYVNSTLKSFIIDHPDNINKYLVHVCLEGPESGVYYRGKGRIEDGVSMVVILPDYVASLAYDFTIQITPIYDGMRKTGVYQVSEVVNNRFSVYGENGGFYWIVHGKRGEVAVEPDKDSIVVCGSGPYLWIE